MNERQKGFTLVEVIVVLVILAILAAIMIPAMTGWIDKSRESQAQMECRSCVLAAQGIAVERYAAGKQYALSADKAETEQLAEVPDATDIISASVSVATLTSMKVLASNGLYATYTNGAYSISNTSGASFSGKDTLNKIYPIFAAASGVNNNTFYSPDKGNLPDGVAEQLAAAGVDLTDPSITWSIRYEGANGYPKLYWAKKDDLSAGGTAYMMTYSFEVGTNKDQKGNYNVWTVKTTKNPTTGAWYISGEGTQLTNSDSEKTFEGASAKYEELTGHSMQ